MSEWFRIEDKDDLSLSEDGSMIHVLFASNDWGNQYIEIPVGFVSELLKGPKCHFCGKPATKLCDHPMKGPDGLYSLKAGTCDLAICDDHATVRGKTFDMYEKGGIDSMDHCPFHSDADRKELVKPVKEPS